MTEPTITFYCNDCDTFPSSVTMTSNGMMGNIFIECTDCGGIEKFQG